MPDLVDRLRELERNPAPDAWADIERRSAEIADRGAPRTPQPSGRRTRVIAAIVALALSVGAITFVDIAFRGVQPKTPAAPIRENGAIVYVAAARATSQYRPENSDVFAYDPTTGRTVNLTQTPTVGELAVVWSPDGTRVAFERMTRTRTATSNKTESELVIANADFSSQHVIRHCPGGCGVPQMAWSPDDSRLAIVAEEPVGSGSVDALEVYDIASGTKTIMCDSRTCGWPGNPVWSPDGTEIAFDNSGVNRLPYLGLPHGPIWVADVTTGQAKPLTDGSTSCASKTGSSCLFDTSPAWSSDGRYIAFVRTKYGRGGVAQTMEMFATADGGLSYFLAACAADEPQAEGPPVWSGRHTIAFVQACEPRTYQPTLNVHRPPNGPSTVIRLPRSVGANPAGLLWSPDGRELAFFGDDSSPNLYLADPSTGKVREAVSRVAYASDMTWLPAGSIDPSVFQRERALPSVEPTPTSGDVSSSGLANYDFSNVQVKKYQSLGHVTTHSATIGFTVSWASDEYPGVHNCTWTALDDQGSVIDTYTDRLLSTGRRTISTITMDVSRRPSTATISCEARRIDVPVAFLTRHVHLAQGEISGSFEVVFEAVPPPGVPSGSFVGANACDIEIHDSSGEVVISHRFTLAVGSEGSNRVHERLASASLPQADRSVQGLTPTISCAPLTADTSG